MKKTLTTILIFAAVLSAMLALAALAERVLPQPEPVEAAETSAAAAELTSGVGGGDILLEVDRARVTGRGALSQAGTVTIAYPGTYYITGSLTDGQIVIDCGDLSGAVCLVLDGVEIVSSSGPAIYVKNAELTVLELAAGSQNKVLDGADYVLTEGTKTNTGAAIYSADDLVLRGEGTLTVSGAAADGIRSKDGLTVESGVVTVYAVDDALQGSDYVTVTGGILSLHSYGDGVKTTEGNVNISGGGIHIICGGDGIDSAQDVSVTGGELTVTAYGGAEQYEAIARGGISAKGIKGMNIDLAGGTVTLNTADDGVHADDSITVSAGVFTILSGDDAFHADQRILMRGGTVAAVGYEGLEADAVRLDDGAVEITAQNNGVDAGAGGFVMAGGAFTAAAEDPIASDAAPVIAGGTAILIPTEADSSLYLKDAVVGGTLVLLGAGTQPSLTEDGTMGASFLCLFPAGLPAGTELTVTDEAERQVLTVTVDRDCTAVLLTSGAMAVGQTYTVTAGEDALTAALTEGCTILQSAAWNNQGGMGNAGGPSGGPFGGPMR